MTQIKCVVRRPTRSLSAGANKEHRELVSFKSNQDVYIQIYNLLLDNYIRIRHAFMAMDELWLYLLEKCFPEMEKS